MVDMAAADLYWEVIESPPFEDSRLFPSTDPDDPACRFFARLVKIVRPLLIVELGTGVGRAAAQFAAAMSEDCRLVTINWPNPPSGDMVGVELIPWWGDKRISLVLGDTREQSWRFVSCLIDLLYIDSTHTYDCAKAEWDLYRVHLADGAVVVVDDLNHNDMEQFWLELPYNKCRIFGGRSGMFIYGRDGVS